MDNKPVPAVASMDSHSSPEPDEPRKGPHTPASLSVPLIQPRFRRHTRLQCMRVTESDVESQRTAAQILRQRSIEALTIHSGKGEYHSEIRYHAYALYRDGSRRFHSTSVGYSSDGDLVLMKDELSSASDADLGLHRVAVSVSSAVCLDPAARPPVAQNVPEKVVRRMKKYPGVRCPKSRRVRNRLCNDHFFAPESREILQKCELAAGVHHNGSESSDDSEKGHGGAFFGEVPETFTKLLNRGEKAQEAELDRMGVAPAAAAAVSRTAMPADPNCAESRWAQLNARLRGELQHALVSEFLTVLIRNMEVAFANYVTNADGGAPPVGVWLQDGYARLLCHAVAAYYRLRSFSQEDESGERRTYVAVPKKRVELPATPLLTFLSAKHSETNKLEQTPTILRKKTKPHRPKPHRVSAAA